MTINDKNKLIAEFMGEPEIFSVFHESSYFGNKHLEYAYKADLHQTIDHYAERFGDGIVSEKVVINYMNFENLMPVVQRIKDTATDTDEFLKQQDEIDDVLTCDLRIDYLHEAVVQFIIEYNQTKS